MLGRKPKPQSYRALIIERGGRPGPVARARAQVVVREVEPRRWRVMKNTTGKRIRLEP